MKKLRFDPDFERNFEEIHKIKAIKVADPNGTSKDNHQEDKGNFMRVADDYFEVIVEPRRFGPRTIIQHRKKEELRQDNSSDWLKGIRKFKKFIIIPDNVNYKREHGDFFNLYSPFAHKPAKGSTTATESFLKHIFGDQYEEGLEYLQVLYERPWQILPVLVLVSKERNTGKSTLLNWLSMLFGDNLVNVDPSDLANQFNHIYATKNIITVEETIIDKKHTVERIKRISTQKELTVNQKYVSQFTIDFYGKIILCTNSETTFMKVDEQEIRFWVRKLPSIPKEKLKPGIEDDLKKEIPAFLGVLKNRELKYPKKESRMHFPIGVLDNEELRAVKEESHTWLYKELWEHFAEYFYNNSGDITATAKEIKREHYSGNNQVSIPWIRKVLKEEFGLEPSEIIRYNSTFSAGVIKVQGRPYTITRAMFKIDEDDEKLPF